MSNMGLKLSRERGASSNSWRSVDLWLEGHREDVMYKCNGGTCIGSLVSHRKDLCHLYKDVKIDIEWYRM